jgi:hypothetical protein
VAAILKLERRDHSTCIGSTSTSTSTRSSTPSASP